jgi:glucose-6-phosphate 1-dehydrogenase
VQPVPAEPCTIVIFGASGDLARRKLLPSLQDLHRKRLLDPATDVVGFARTAMTDEAFRAAASADAAAEDRAAWDAFAPRLHYVVGQYGQTASYRQLRARLEALERERGGEPARRLFYLATPPDAADEVVSHLAAAGLAQSAGGGWSRVILEKPFGRDLASARALNAVVAAVFDEDEVFRIDHYLGKETVQNLLVFRMANGIFEPVWNHHFVDHVQITVAETLGVEGRAGYYEEAGVSRDILQNHLLQLLTLVAMEPPILFEANAVRDEKVKVLRSIRALEGEAARAATVRGRYAAGTIDGRAVPGYREEPGVSPRSRTETYLAARFQVDNWRWSGVPFYVRSGKRLARRVTEIDVVFRRPPFVLFPGSRRAQEPNVLELRIQPDEGVALRVLTKAPGPEERVTPVLLDFLYAEAYGGRPPEAYERLIHDALTGDPTLFARRDEVEYAWEIVDRLVGAWESAPDEDLREYPAGSWGPAEADRLLEQDGRVWQDLS